MPSVSAPIVSGTLAQPLWLLNCLGQVGHARAQRIVRPDLHRVYLSTYEYYWYHHTRSTTVTPRKPIINQYSVFVDRTFSK
jgi:hypothetical protein